MMMAVLSQSAVVTRSNVQPTNRGPTGAAVLPNAHHHVHLGISFEFGSPAGVRCSPGAAG